VTLPFSSTGDASPMRPGLRHTWLAFLLLLIGLILTFAASWLAREQVQSKLAAVFQSQNAEVLYRLRTAINERRGILVSLQSLHDGNVREFRDAFASFAGVQTRVHQDIGTICYAPKVSVREKYDYIDHTRNQGPEYAGFDIFPSGDREEYFPLEFIVPLIGNRDALGLDIASENYHREAVHTARTTGSISATPLLSLKAEGSEGFVMVAPLYVSGMARNTVNEREQAFLGVCVLTIRSREFIRHAVMREADSSMIAISVYDGLLIDPEALLYSEVAPRDPVIQQSIPVNFAGHSWTVVSRAKSSIRDAVSTALPIYTLVTGAAGSLLLFVLTFSLATSRSRALALAERMSSMQRRLVHSSQHLLAVLDLNGTWQSINPASSIVLGHTPEELVGKSIEQHLAPADRARVRSLLARAEDETPCTFIAKHHAKSGNQRWITWSMTVSRKDALVYCIGIDVTTHIEAEFELRQKDLLLDIAALVTDRENIRKKNEIREQNFRLRMQLTTTLGFLRLIIEDATIDKTEILDFVRTANESAENLLSEIRHMTKKELHTIKNISVDVRQYTAPELLSSLLDRVDEFQSEKEYSLEKETSPVPEAIVQLDMGIFVNTVDTILALLSPYITEASSLAIQFTRKRREGWLILDLRFENLTNLPDTSCWIPALSRKEMLGLRDDTDFSMAILHCFFEVMNARFEISNNANNDGCMVNFRFLDGSDAATSRNFVARATIA